MVSFHINMDKSKSECLATDADQVPQCDALEEMPNHIKLVNQAGTVIL